MRAKSLLIIGLAAVILAPVTGLTQPPMGGPPGMGGGPPMMFSRDRGSDGGRRSFFSDPSAMFDRFANGKPSFTRDELDERGKWFFDNILVNRMGWTGGNTVNRDAFVSFMQQRQADRERNGGGPGGPPGSLPSTGGPGGDSGAMAEGFFRRADRNSDGLLSFDEMSDNLKPEREKWDANKDGFIDLTEYKAYIAAVMAQRQQGGGPGSPPPGALPPGAMPGATPAEEEKEEERPTVYRAGKLPKDIPAWFTQYDGDADGQVGFYEWRTSGKRVDEFREMDRNGDGFVTAEEVLWFQKAQASAKPDQGGPPGMGGPPMMGRGGPPSMDGPPSTGGPPSGGDSRGPSSGDRGMSGDRGLRDYRSRDGDSRMSRGDRGDRGGRERGGRERGRP